jgi:hypothetical protein
MFETFSKKITSVFATFDKGFKDLDDAVDQLDTELDKKVVPPGPGTEHETVVEETRPDGTKIVTRTFVRRTK